MGDGVRVKICGLMRREDALAADLAGADYLGVVVSGGFDRSVTPAVAKAIVESTAALKVAVVVDEHPDAIESAARAIGAHVIQLHGRESPGVLDEVRARGSWALWKVVRARSLDDVARGVERYRQSASGILVEGWKKGSIGGGGAQVTLDGKHVRERIPGDMDFVLAGGLNPETVADALRRFGPDVVDVSSGVERVLGEKDHARVRAFVQAARRTFAEPASAGSRTSAKDASR